MSSSKPQVAPAAPKAGTRLRLTLAGWLFIGLALLVGMAAGKSQAAMVFILCGGMLGALHISAWLAWRVVACVDVQRDLTNRAWQNQTVHLSYHLRNVSRRTSALALHVEEHAPAGIESAAGFCVHLPAQSVFRAGARFVARTRGRVCLGAIQLRTSFPFGLVTANRLLVTHSDLVVWPARGQLKRQLLTRGAVETSRSAPSLVSGGQDEFFGLREYRPDDNPRWIHWRRSAAKAVPVVREMSRPLPDVLMLVVDTFVPEDTPQAREARETRLSFAATLLDWAFARGYRVGLALGGEREPVVLSPAEGRAQRTALLDALADVGPNPAVAIDAVASAIRRGSLRNAQTLLAVATDNPRAGLAAEVIRRASRCVSVVNDADLPMLFEPRGEAGEGGDAP